LVLFESLGVVSYLPSIVKNGRIFNRLSENSVTLETKLLGLFKIIKNGAVR